MIIIGITGTLGAGKGTVVDYLVNKQGFTHYSVRDFLRTKLEMRGMPVTRDTLTAIANELRARFGAAYAIESLLKQALENTSNAVIESIRTTGEIQTLRKQPGFFLLAIDADPRLRYRRIKLRNSETDQVSFNTFIMNEEREMHTQDPGKQNLAACIGLADYRILNNHDRSALNRQVKDIIQRIQDGHNQNKS